MIIISDSTNRIINGILGVILNLFYFVVSCIYIKETFPRHIFWDIFLGIIFVVWIFYCITFGIKWEMKHLESKMKRIEQEEDRLLTNLEGQMNNLHNSIQDSEKEELKEKIKNI